MHMMIFRIMLSGTSNSLTSAGMLTKELIGSGGLFTSTNAWVTSIVNQAVSDTQYHMLISDYQN